MYQFYYLGLSDPLPKKLLREYTGLEKGPWDPERFSQLVRMLRLHKRSGLAGALELMAPDSGASSPSGSWLRVLRQVCRDYPVSALLRPRHTEGEDPQASQLMASISGLAARDDSQVARLRVLEQAFPAFAGLAGEQRWQEGVPNEMRAFIMELQGCARAARSFEVHAREMKEGELQLPQMLHQA